MDWIYNPNVIMDKIIKKHDLITHKNNFFKYQGGYWQVIDDTEIYNMIQNELGNKSRERYIKEIKFMLSYKLNVNNVNNVNLINLKNGMFDIESMSMVEHDKKYFSTIQLPYEYDSTALCPLWEKTLREIFLDNTDKIETLQEFMGYCLTTDNSYQKALLNVGDGANGKSLIFKVLETILGSENISNVSIGDLHKGPYLAQMFNKLANISLESETLESINDAMFKSVVSGDRIIADEKYKKPFSFNPFCKLIFSMNTLPYINDKTEAFYRRLLILKYDKQFSTEEQNINLYNDLMPELSGIFNWVLVGLNRLNQRGCFALRKEMVDLVEEYKKDNNPALFFLEDHIYFDREKTLSSSLTKKEVYDKYKEWCKENGYKAVSDKSLGKQIKKTFSGVKEGRTNAIRLWAGLDWRTELTELAQTQAVGANWDD